jgi:hypothetical protein
VLAALVTVFMEGSGICRDLLLEAEMVQMLQMKKGFEAFVFMNFMFVVSQHCNLTL